MNHPIIGSRRAAISYFGAWLLVYFVDVAITLYYSKKALEIVMVQDGVFCAVFSLLGITLWYIVNSCRNPRSWVLIALNHITYATFFVLFWYLVSSSIVKALLPASTFESQPYSEVMPFIILVGGAGYIITVLGYYLHIYSEDLHLKHENEVMLQKSLKEVEINMLRAQINPHFLFNSLNSVSSLTMVDGEKAQEMVVKLSDYLRYTVSQATADQVPLRMELENIHRYLDIEKVRFGQKLKYSFVVDDMALEVGIPAMILQPLFENAIKHGVYESTEPIEITTTVSLEEEAMVVAIRNNYEKSAPMSKGAGIGLRNIAERLRLIYYNDKLLRINDDGSHFEVVIIIPIAPKK